MTPIVNTSGSLSEVILGDRLIGTVRSFVRVEGQLEGKVRKAVHFQALRADMYEKCTFGSLDSAVEHLIRSAVPADCPLVTARTKAKKTKAYSPGLWDAK